MKNLSIVAQEKRMLAVLLLLLVVAGAIDTVHATEISARGLPNAQANDAALRQIITIVNGLVGAIALLVMVVSGLRYITSGGDPQKAANAKNGVVYALIGVAIVIAAQAIITFVVRRL